ncbi:MAG: hypothetical protein ACHQWH_01660, partial [Nitrososphaerales archaeon]
MTMSSVSSFGFDLRERIRKGDANLRTGNIGNRSICLQDFHGLSVKIGLLYVTTGTINMKKVKVATGLLVASLILLIIYGADVAVSTSGVGSPSHSGFLPINKAARGG